MERRDSDAGIAGAHVCPLLLVVPQLVRQGGGAVARNALRRAKGELGMAPKGGKALHEAAAIDDHQPEILERVGHVRPDHERTPI